MRQTDSTLLGVEDAAHSDLAHPNHLPLAPIMTIIHMWSVERLRTRIRRTHASPPKGLSSLGKLRTARIADQVDSRNSGFGPSDGEGKSGS
jgi:hypothetical protein